MKGANFYLLSALPVPGPFGSPPPLTKENLLAMVETCDGPLDLVRTLLLADDLMEREAILAGEIPTEEARLMLLPLPETLDEDPLAPFLVQDAHETAEEAGGRIPVDRIWTRFFHFAMETARGQRSRFLRNWATFEVGLRNAVARSRAQTLGLDPMPYLVAPELGDDAWVGPALEAWAGADHPLAALAALDRARWDWVLEQEPWFSFSDDELAGYTVKILILERWRRIQERSISS